MGNCSADALPSIVQSNENAEEYPAPIAMEGSTGWGKTSPSDFCQICLVA